MVTIDANGALHDGLGQFSQKPQNAAGFDIGPAAAPTVQGATRLVDLIAGSGSTSLPAADFGRTGEADVDVNRYYDGTMDAGTSVFIPMDTLAPSDVPANDKARWAHTQRDRVTDYLAERYAAQYAFAGSGRAEVRFVADLDSDATVTDAFTTLDDKTRLTALREQMRAEADGVAEVPVGDDIGVYVAHTEAVNRAMRKTGLKPRSDLAVKPSADQFNSELTITVTNTEATTYDGSFLGNATARVVRTAPPRKGLHGNTLNPGWALTGADGKPLTPEQNTLFLRALGEKVVNKADDPRTYEGPDAAMSLISTVMGTWREQRKNGGA